MLFIVLLFIVYCVQCILRGPRKLNIIVYCLLCLLFCLLFIVLVLIWIGVPVNHIKGCVKASVALKQIQAKDAQRYEELKNGFHGKRDFPALVTMIRKYEMANMLDHVSSLRKRNKASFYRYYLGALFKKKRVRDMWRKGVDHRGKKN